MRNVGEKGNRRQTIFQNICVFIQLFNFVYILFFILFSFKKKRYLTFATE